MLCHDQNRRRRVRPRPCVWSEAARIARASEFASGRMQRLIKRCHSAVFQKERETVTARDLTRELPPCRVTDRFLHS